MLVSHKYKFIFIKTRKTAGTSIEVDLSKLMADEDIVTPIFPVVDGHIPRNHEGPHGSGIRFYNHMPALEVRQLLASSQFDGYFKFCVEREPVDKCISHYSMLKNSTWHNQRDGSLTWENYLRQHNFPVDSRLYLDQDGKLMVDKIVKYENLNAELSVIGERLGFKFDAVQSRAKSGFRENITVTEPQRKMIYDAFAASLPFTEY